MISQMKKASEFIASSTTFTRCNNEAEKQLEQVFKMFWTDSKFNLNFWRKNLLVFQITFGAGCDRTSNMHRFTGQMSVPCNQNYFNHRKIPSQPSVHRWTFPLLHLELDSPHNRKWQLDKLNLFQRAIKSCVRYFIQLVGMRWLS